MSCRGSAWQPALYPVMDKNVSADSTLPGSALAQVHRLWVVLPPWLAWPVSRCTLPTRLSAFSCGQISDEVLPLTAGCWPSAASQLTSLLCLQHSQWHLCGPGPSLLCFQRSQWHLCGPGQSLLCLQRSQWHLCGPGLSLLCFQRSQWHRCGPGQSLLCFQRSQWHLCGPGQSLLCFQRSQWHRCGPGQNQSAMRGHALMCRRRGACWRQLQPSGADSCASSSGGDWHPEGRSCGQATEDCSLQPASR